MSDLPQIFLNDSGQPYCLSSDVAEHFGKNHRDVLRGIDNLVAELPTDFRQRNFAQSSRVIQAGFDKREERVYQLSRDAFTLLVMGFTGKSALSWKLKYIEAFNRLERLALEKREALIREAGLGRQEAHSIGDSRKAWLAGLKEGKRLAGKQSGLANLERLYQYVQKGLTHAEIGKILGLNAATVSRRVRRAKKLARIAWVIMTKNEIFNPVKAARAAGSSRLSCGGQGANLLRSQVWLILDWPLARFFI